MELKRKELKKIITDYNSLYSCAVSDAIDELGLEPGFLPHDFRPIWPGARIIGFAGIIKMIPSEEPLDDNVIAKLGTYFGQMPKFPIFCVDMDGKMLAAGLGQGTSRILRGFGFKGGLVNGPVRDIPQVTAQGFPIFARGIICSSIRGRMNIDFDAVNKPFNIGDRTIHPGDLIFGDINGVVVVHQENLLEVLEKAKEIASTDEWWYKQLENGRDPSDIEKERPLP
ncbi:MAG: RraA family protein [Candidatus Lokiarchaeota archaeon]|nr:RraA family protein [Candidatus Lokiarchaeota archaeon]